MSNKKRNPSDLKNLHVDTLGVRAGVRRTEFNEHSEAMFLTSSFCFDTAEDAAEGFANAEKGFIYSRFTNPTVAMFQDRLAALEGGEACIATSSGMSAIMTVAMAHLQAGDHVICSRSVFGATIQLFSVILGKFGIETTYVDMSDLGAWKAAVKPNTKLFFLETPSNPLTEVADIAAIAKIAKAAGAIYAVDNCFCTPILQRPLEMGADLVIHSATKYLDGQGRVRPGRGGRGRQGRCAHVCNPHSVLEAPAQRPLRGSLPGAGLLVQGAQPMDGYPSSTRGLTRMELVSM